jgi:hypothetical protein
MRRKYAIRAIAQVAEAGFELRYLEIAEAERRSRSDRRWRTKPGSTLRHERGRPRPVPGPVPATDAGRTRLRAASRATAGIRQLAALGQRPLADLPRLD